jgi:hypothetical protein
LPLLLLPLCKRFFLLFLGLKVSLIWQAVSSNVVALHLVVDASKSPGAVTLFSNFARVTYRPGADETVILAFNLVSILSEHNYSPLVPNLRNAVPIDLLSVDRYKPHQCNY